MLWKLLSFRILAANRNELRFGLELQMSRMKKVLGLLAFVLAYPLFFRGYLHIWYTGYHPSFSTVATEDLVIGFTSIIAYVLLFIIAVLIFYRRRAREKRLADEAEKWLATRNREQTSPVAARRRALRRSLLWAPSVMVSLVFPFIPEATGVASHVFVSRTAQLGKCHVHTPITWMIDSRGDDHLSAMTAPGIGRIGLRRYLRLEVPLSEMVFLPIDHPEEQLSRNVVLKGETVLGKRSFPLGNETLTCRDLIHNNRFVGPSPTDPSIADISCTTETDDFYVHFSGWRRDSAVFYETLQKITVDK
jgi:hypothetical protein